MMLSNEGGLEPPQEVVDEARSVAIAAMKRCVSEDLDTGQETIDTTAAAEVVADEVVGLAWAAFASALPVEAS